MSRSDARTRKLLSLAVLLFLLTASSLQAEMRKVRAVVTPYLSFAPYFIALEEGMFERHGIEVEFIRFTHSAKTIPALISGDVDVVAGTVFASYFNAIAQGANLRFVADRGHQQPAGCGSQAIVVRKDLVLDGRTSQPGWLKGKRLAVTGNTSPGRYVTDQLLEEQGLSQDDLQLAFLPTPNRIQAFATDSIDITALNEPHLTRALDSGHAVVLKSAGQARPYFQQGVIAFGPSLLDKDPEAGRRFIAAYLEGVRQFMEGKTDANVASIARHTELEEELVRRLCWPTIRSDGRINAQSVMNLQQWFLTQGLIDRVIPVEDFWDPQFVEHADQVLKGH